MWVPYFGGTPSSTFFGSLIGVFFAYLLAKGTERYLNVQKRAKWLELIRKELNQAHSDLVKHEKDIGFFLAIHNELLKSLVSSTDISLFNANEAIALTRLYTKLDNYHKNIERINIKIKQFEDRASIEDPEYKPLFEELHELEEQQKKGDVSLKTVDRITKIKEKIGREEAYLAPKIGKEWRTGVEYRTRMKKGIEKIMEQEWVRDEERHLFFPKHMNKYDEEANEMIEVFTKVPLIPGEGS